MPASLLEVNPQPQVFRNVRICGMSFVSFDRTGGTDMKPGYIVQCKSGREVL
jgi:hypothetical protein